MTECEVEVETYCPYKRRQVLLILQVAQEPKGDIVEGKPLFCNFMDACSKPAPPSALCFPLPTICFLHALRIETIRRT